VLLEADRKAFSFSAVNENTDENETPFTAENENRHSFSAEKQKRKSPDNISVFFFSYIQSPSQPYNAPPIFRPVSPFLQVVLVGGIPLSSCRPTVYRYLCGIFLVDIAFLVYCYGMKAIFHNLCTVLYWRLCDLTNSPHC